MPSPDMEENSPLVVRPSSDGVASPSGFGTQLLNVLLVLLCDCSYVAMFIIVKIIFQTECFAFKFPFWMTFLDVAMFLVLANCYTFVSEFATN